MYRGIQDHRDTNINFSKIMGDTNEQHHLAIGNFHPKGQKRKMESRIPSKTLNNNGKKWCVPSLGLLGFCY